MRYLSVFLLGLVMAIQVQAADPRCLISFDSGGYNACTGEAIGPAYSNPLARSLPQAAEDSRFRVVKFDQPITAAMRAQVEASGAEILGYLPFHSYLVRVDDAGARLAAIDGVLWTGAFRNSWKLDASLIGLGETGGRPTALPLHIALHAGSAAEPLQAMLADLPGVENSFVDVATSREAVVLNVLGSALDDLLPQLVSIDDVAHVGIRKLMDFNNSQGTWLHQSGQTDLVPMFDRGLFGCGQLVGVADSGVDFPHCAFTDPDLASPVISDCADGANCPVASPDFNHRKIPIYYKWSPASDPLGDSACPGGASSGHGTHVAGSILGNNLANPVDCATLSTPGGITDLDGMAPGARLVAQEMGDSLQYLNSLGGNIPHLVSVAHANGARIHNNSWGGGCCFLGLFCIPGCTVSYDAFSQDADRAAWDFPDMAIFFAAGNDGTCCTAPRSVGSPGNAKNVISVGATQRGAAGDSMASFSSRGPVHDNRTKPDIVAQGQGVISVASNGSATSGSCGTCPLSGTSMASPTAAGMAALVREYLERGFYPSGTETATDARDFISGALIKALLVNSRQTIGGSNSGGAAPNQNQGWGRINLENVLHFEGGDRPLWLVDYSDGLATGETFEETLQVAEGQPLMITLAWTDYPAAIGASVAMVNQLRLEVEDPSGQVWTQKLPASNPPNPFADTSDIGHDNRNNVHQIRFDAPEAGDYRITVRSIQTAMGDRQPFAVVANGALTVDTTPGFELTASPADVSVCQGDPASILVEVASVAEFANPVDLSISDGLPPAVDWSFATNPVVPSQPAATTLLQIDTALLPANSSYTVTITGQADPLGEDEPLVRSTILTLGIEPEQPDIATLLLPVDGAIDVGVAPEFTWSEANGAVAYRLQVASDADFDTPLVDLTVSDTSAQPDTLLPITTELFWRVASLGACGDADFGPTFQFTTANFPQARIGNPLMSMVMEPDTSGIGTVMLDNIGSLPLNWSVISQSGDGATGGDCIDPASLSWLSLPITDGEIEPGQSEGIDFQFDSTGMAMHDVEETRVCIATDDPHQAILGILTRLRIGTDPLFDDRFEE